MAGWCNNLNNQIDDLLQNIIKANSHKLKKKPMIHFYKMMKDIFQNSQCLSVILFKFDGDLFFLIIGGMQKLEEHPFKKFYETALP